MIRSTLKRLGGQLLERVRSPAAAVRTPPPAPPEPADRPADADALSRIDAGAQEVKERIDAGEPVVLLDVRTPAEVATGRIAGALTIPVDELEARWSELERCDEVVCYCASGGRSRRAAELLRARGLFNATSMTGGVAAWTAAGGALVQG